MKRPETITKDNLKKKCWKLGMSVKGLADKIGKSRVTVHRAVKKPNQFGPTYRDICEVLNAQQN